jgi:hypothetical protein
MEIRDGDVLDLEIGVGAAANAVHSKSEVNQRILQSGGFDKEFGHSTLYSYLKLAEKASGLYRQRTSTSTDGFVSNFAFLIEQRNSPRSSTGMQSDQALKGKHNPEVCFAVTNPSVEAGAKSVAALAEIHSPLEFQLDRFADAGEQRFLLWLWRAANQLDHAAANRTQHQHLLAAPAAKAMDAGVAHHFPAMRTLVGHLRVRMAWTNQAAVQ